MRRLAKLCMALFMALTASISHAQQRYILTDLTTGSPYDYIEPTGINNQGQITGAGEIASTYEIHAFLYQQGSFQDLGLLGYGGTAGAAINNAGQLAINAFGPGTHALFYANGKAQSVGSIDDGYTTAYAINNQGDIVGDAINGDNQHVGFFYSQGTINDLSLVGIYRAVSINDSQQIVGSIGYYWTQIGYLFGVAHACLYSNGTVTDLGSLSGNPRTNTEAYGINNAGQIVGYSTASDGLYHAFLYSSGSMHDLGTMGNNNAIATAINNTGQIIGVIQNIYGATLGSFVYENDAMYSLDSLLLFGDGQWSQLVATGINDNGWIIGYGTVNGATHGFLARPLQFLPINHPTQNIF